MSISIVLADDHRIIRDGLKSLIRNERDMEVVAEAEDGLETVSLCERFSPDIVIMDISMPGLNGIEATRQIISRFPKTKVVALSIHSDTVFVSGLLRAGGAGYLIKKCAFAELVEAIRAVASGHIYLSQSITDLVVEDYLKQPHKEQPEFIPTLTSREREVLQLLAEGYSTKSIAKRLYISSSTVETHRYQIMRKLDLRSIAELTKYAIRAGLTSLEG